jgi:hypothetical protein
MKKRDLLSAISDKTPRGRPKISDTEWLMFRDCPEEELKHCLIYEFSRDSLELKKWTDWLRSQLKQKANATASELLHTFPNEPVSRYPTRLFYTTAGKFIIACIDEFPTTPWLDLPAKMRDRLVSEFWPSADPFTAEELLTKYGSPALLAAPLRSLRIDDAANGPYNFAVKINWDETDAELRKRFDLWLRRNRPPAPKPKDTRGRTSYRDLLKTLACYRLLLHGFTANDAAVFTQKVLNKPLYEEESSWSKQRKRAAELIGTLVG